MLFVLLQDFREKCLVFKKVGHVEFFQWSTVAAGKVLNSEGQKVNTESAVDTAKDNSQVDQVYWINRSTEYKQNLSSIVERLHELCTLDMCAGSSLLRYVVFFAVYIRWPRYPKIWEFVQVRQLWSLQVANQHVDGESRRICHKIKVLKTKWKDRNAESATIAIWKGKSTICIDVIVCPKMTNFHCYFCFSGRCDINSHFSKSELSRSVVGFVSLDSFPSPALSISEGHEFQARNLKTTHGFIIRF